MNERKAVRSVFLTPGGRILLMKIEEPVTGYQFWITPGGGIEPSESAEEGLRREVEEETGVKAIQIGPMIWTREHEFTWDGRAYRQEEVYYLIETEWFEPEMNEEAAPGEWSAFRGFHWWSVEEIKNSEETFVPRDLYILLKGLIENGPPEEPMQVGI